MIFFERRLNIPLALDKHKLFYQRLTVIRRLDSTRAAGCQESSILRSKLEVQRIKGVLD
jgi:hypothetical protein